MKIVLNRKGYMDERPIFITCILIAIYSVVQRLGLSLNIMVGSYIVIIGMYILSAFMCIYYDQCLSVKVRKKSFIKYYNNTKYVIVDESTNSKITENIFNEYVNVDFIHRIYTNSTYSKDKKVRNAFTFTYKSPSNSDISSKYTDLEKTFLVYKENDYLSSKL